MAYEINEVVIIDGNRNVVNAGIITASKLRLDDGAGVLVEGFVDEDDMSSDSNLRVPTQQSVKAYTDAVGAANEVHIDNLVTLTGVAKDGDNLGTFSGSTISDECDISGALQELEEAVEANEVHIDNAATLSGVAKDSVDLGTFTGTTISDASTIKAALQDLETGVDNALGGGAAATTIETVTVATDAAHYLTFVNSDNGSGSQESVFTDAGIQYNPSSNILTAGEIVVTGNLTVNGSQTVIESSTLTVEDKNIELGKVASPTDATADGGGITLKGTIDKTLNWVDATDSWTSSENLDLASGKVFAINDTSVLSSDTLGAGVVNSSLTSVGNLTNLNVINDLGVDGEIAGNGSTNIVGMNTITAAGKMYALSYTSTSDAALKTNVVEIADATDKVKAIRGVTFDWTDGSGPSAGIIAQEVEAILPSIVSGSSVKQVEYNGLVGLLVEAVKELSARIDVLENS